MLLAGLLGLIALKSYRRAQGVTPLIAGTLTVAALATAGGGFNLLQQVQAGIDTTPITQSDGQSFPLFDRLNRFRNDAGIPVSATDIEVIERCSIIADEGPDPDCEVGLELEDGSSCQLVVTCEPFVFDDSDRRLKTDISLMRVAGNGLPVYRFRYRNGTQYYEGVMAQDVLDYKPEAVVRKADGYYAVNYGMLDMRMRRVD